MDNKHLPERGALSIIIALIMIIVITSSAVVLSGTLSRQIRASQDVITTETALYAANSGFEHALYVRLKKGQDVRSSNEVSGELSDGDDVATYTGQAYLTADQKICALGVGKFLNLTRKLAIGTTGCTF